MQSKLPLAMVATTVSLVCERGKRFPFFPLTCSPTFFCCSCAFRSFCACARAASCCRLRSNSAASFAACQKQDIRSQNVAGYMHQLLPCPGDVFFVLHIPHSCLSSSSADPSAACPCFKRLHKWEAFFVRPTRLRLQHIIETRAHADLQKTWSQPTNFDLIAFPSRRLFMQHYDLKGTPEAETLPSRTYLEPERTICASQE